MIGCPQPKNLTKGRALRKKKSPTEAFGTRPIGVATNTKNVYLNIKRTELNQFGVHAQGGASINPEDVAYYVFTYNRRCL